MRLDWKRYAHIPKRKLFMPLQRTIFFVSKSNHLEPFGQVLVSLFSAYPCLLIVLTAYVEQKSKWEVI